jgi:hypothetical protein
VGLEAWAALFGARKHRRIGSILQVPGDLRLRSLPLKDADETELVRGAKLLSRIGKSGKEGDLPGARKRARFGAWWTATSSNTQFLEIVAGASGSGVDTVGFTVLNNTHNGQQSYTITVASGAASATYTVTEAGSGDSQVYREIYALYEQLLGRDPDPAGFAFWSGSGGAGQGPDGGLISDQSGGLQQRLRGDGGLPGRHWRSAYLCPICSGGGERPGRHADGAGAVQLAARCWLYRSHVVPESAEPGAGGGDSACIGAGLGACFQTIIGYPSSTTPAGARTMSSKAQEPTTRPQASTTRMHCTCK